MSHKNLIGGFILGEQDFISWIKETFLLSRKEDKEIPQLKKLKHRLTPEAVVSEVSKKFAIDKDAVIEKGMKRNKVRDGYLSLQKSQRHYM